MELIEIIVIIACVLIVGSVIASNIIKRRKGVSSCCGNCSKCKGCHNSNNDTNRENGF